MGVRHYKELHCWRLANELKRKVYAILARPEVRKDFDFCQQLRSSARSAPSNIAEGFARFRPADFARFLEIARASLAESDNHLNDGVDLGYLNKEECQEMCRLADRASGATLKLILYLRSKS